MADAVIRIIGYAPGIPCDHAGLYLKTFDHEAHNGVGEITCTADVHEAMRFPDSAAALMFWKKRSVCRPTRPDGKPNRPLTAATIEVFSPEDFDHAETDAEAAPKAEGPADGAGLPRMRLH